MALKGLWIWPDQAPEILDEMGLIVVTGVVREHLQGGRVIGLERFEYLAHLDDLAVVLRAHAYASEERAVEAAAVDAATPCKLGDPKLTAMRLDKVDRIINQTGRSGVGDAREQETLQPMDGFGPAVVPCEFPLEAGSASGQELRQRGHGVGQAAAVNAKQAMEAGGRELCTGQADIAAKVHPRARVA